jgi:hypothetical protein
MASVALSITVQEVSIPHEGFSLRGRVYRPVADGAYPAAAICHGYIGNTKNMDIAEDLAMNGVVALVFYYQGAWGSGGTFSLTGLAPSARDAIDWLRQQHYVDTDRVGLVGHSLGAVPVAQRLNVDDRLRAGVFIAPAADLTPLATGDSAEIFILNYIVQAEGKLVGLTEERLRADLGVLLSEQNPIKLIGSVRAPVMIVVGSDDEVILPDSCRRLYDAANEPKKFVLIKGADHDFAAHRAPLTAEVLGWLREHL